MKTTVDQAFSQALSLHRQGKVLEAIEIYRRILAMEERHFDALHMLGVACRQQGQLSDALTYLDDAVELQPGNAFVHSNRGNLLRDLARHDDAIASFSRALEIKPDFLDAWCNRASLYEFMGCFDNALADLAQVISKQPAHVRALQGQGNALYRARRYEQAVSAFQATLALIPHNADVLSNLGATLMELKRFDEAKVVLDQAIELSPSLAAAFNNRANLHLALRRPQEALVDIDHAIHLQADFADGWLNRGNALQDLKRLPEALASYDRSLELRPNHPHALNNKGNALREMARYGEALALYEQAIALSANYAEAHYHRAIVLQDLQRHEEAEQAFGRAVQLKEDHPKLFGEWVASRLMICAWDGLDILIDKLASKIREGLNASTSFPLLSCGIPGDLVLQCAVNQTREHYPDQSQSFQIAPGRSDKRIKVGYFSSDFRAHAVAQLSVGIFEHHDRTLFNVVGFNVASFPADAMTRRIDQALGGLVQLGNLATADAVAKVRALDLDIAVDLNGHTKGANPNLFAHRIAPIQVNYLGYPGTSGAPYIDYILADATVIPEEHFGYYLEKVVHLPHCYMPSDSAALVVASRPSREDVGLPKEGFVFCCFNNSYKITPQMFGAWMRLLSAVKGSVLWLSAMDPCAVRHLKERACQAGIDTARLVFAPRLRDHVEHLARHGLADLFLDTSPYNAHTTAHDALRAGLPVLTCLGELFPGRVAASLLHAVGLGDLVVNSMAEFEALALQLARTPEQLRTYREILTGSLQSHPLFNTRLFTQNLEKAFVNMQDKVCVNR